MWQLYRRLSLPFPVALDSEGQPCIASGQLPAEFATQDEAKLHFAKILTASAIPLAVAFDFVERPSIAESWDNIHATPQREVGWDARWTAIAIRADLAEVRASWAKCDEVVTAISTILGVDEKDLDNPVLDHHFRTE